MPKNLNVSARGSGFWLQARVQSRGKPETWNVLQGSRMFNASWAKDPNRRQQSPKALPAPKTLLLIWVARASTLNPLLGHSGNVTSVSPTTAWSARQRYLTLAISIVIPSIFATWSFDCRRLPRCTHNCSDNVNSSCQAEIDLEAALTSKA